MREGTVSVPVEPLKNIILIVCDLVLDGEGPDNALAVAVAKDLVQLNDCVPDFLEHLRESYADMLEVPDRDRMEDRQESGRSIIDFFAASAEGDEGEGSDRENLVDVITNLMHFADKEGIDFESAARIAAVHRDQERRDASSRALQRKHLS